MGNSVFELWGIDLCELSVRMYHWLEFLSTLFVQKMFETVNDQFHSLSFKYNGWSAHL